MAQDRWREDQWREDPWREPQIEALTAEHGRSAEPLCEDQKRAIASTREVEPLPRELATVEIDARMSSGAVADRLAALAEPLGTPDLRSST